MTGDVPHLDTIPANWPWRDIASAPRDGSWFVIARFKPDCDPEYEVGCYQAYYWDRYEDAGDGLYRKEKELVGEWGGFNNMHRATHWAPIPAPPVIEERK